MYHCVRILVLKEAINTLRKHTTMTLKTRQLANIESELQTRYHLAHVANTSREQLITAELQGIAVQARCALAAGDVAMMDALRARVQALRAELREMGL